MLVTPEECGIAVAVPLSRDAFVHQYELAIEGSYVFENTRDTRGMTTADDEWQIYQRQAAFLAIVLNEAQDAGVTVVRNAKMDDFYVLATQCRVVSVVAQWKSALFLHADLDGWNVGDAYAARITPGINDGVLKTLLATGKGTPLLTQLNALLTANNPRPQRLFALGEMTHYQTTLHSRRKQIEASGFETLRGGASIEFADGFCRVEDVVAGLPIDTSCIFDLSICNSVLLAQQIKRRCPSSYVLCNEEIAYLAIRAAAYRQIIRRLRRRPSDYVDTCFEINRLMRGK